MVYVVQAVIYEVVRSASGFSMKTKCVTHSIRAALQSLAEGGSEGLLDSPDTAAHWLDVCLGQLVSGRRQTDHLVGLPVLLLLH